MIKHPYEISHIVNDIIEDAFEIKGKIVHVRGKMFMDDPSQNINQDQVDKQLVTLADQMSTRLYEVLDAQTQEAYNDGVKDTQDKIKEALGLSEED